MEKMKKMPGMGGMDKILSKMGVPGGKNLNFGAMQSKMKSNMRAASQRERMLQKLEENKKRRELEKQQQQQQTSPSDFIHSSFGEGIEKSKRSERNKKRRKKKNKNKNKNKNKDKNKL